jgi:hypothetical protein
VKQYHYDGPSTSESLHAFHYYWTGEVIPDGQGGLLAWWSDDYQVQAGPGWWGTMREARLTRVTDSGPTEYPLPAPDWWTWWYAPRDRSLVLGEDGVAFGNFGGRVLSFELAGGTVRWTWEAPSGQLEMIAATAGNGLVAQEAGRVVRLDATGLATYDDWIGGPNGPIDPNTTTNLQYAWGSQWIAIQQSPNPGIHPVAISAPAILWPWSIWSKPSEDDTRASIGPVKVNVFKILEASVDDTFIRAQVNFAIAYWQLNGRILLEWDGSIIPQLGCDPPQGIPDNCAAPYDVYDLTVTKGNKEDGRSPHEAVRRFQSPKGVTYLFVEGFADSATPLDANIALATHGITPLYVDAQGNSYYTNLSILRSENLGLVVPAHETGHQLQLFHVNPISGLANLMCGAVGSPLDWLAYLVPWDCSPTDSNELTHAQIDRARDAATALTGR